MLSAAKHLALRSERMVPKGQTLRVAQGDKGYGYANVSGFVPAKAFPSLGQRSGGTS